VRERKKREIYRNLVKTHIEERNARVADPGSSGRWRRQNEKLPGNDGEAGRKRTAVHGIAGRQCSEQAEI